MIYIQYEKKLRKVMQQVAIMSAYGAGENIHWINLNTSEGGIANIKDHGAGLMWDWPHIEYKIAGDEENYENYY